jgi:hypothetical protein
MLKANYLDYFKIKCHNKLVFFCVANLIIKDENLKKFNRCTISKNYYCKIKDFNVFK